MALACAGVLALGLGATRGWRLATEGQALRIRSIRYHGLSRASADELAALSPVKRGDNLVTADVEAMEQALLRHPWVKSAEVHRALPPSLDVKLTEREAVAIVDLGGMYLVDGDARVFKRAAAGDGLDLPLVTGFTRDDYAHRRPDMEALLRAALALAGSWTLEGLAKIAPISEIHVDAADGVTLYVGDDGTRVRLGSGDLPQKLSRLRTVLASLRADGKKAEVIHLDNRVHPSWVTVRLGVAGSPRAKGQADEPAPERAGGAGERSVVATPRVGR